VEQCSTDSVTYEGTISTIIKDNCVSCHGQSLQSGGIRLDTYQHVKAQADNGNLLGVITHSSGFSPMPKNAPQLSECNIAAISKWIEGGGLNN
jgi:mono/diheme cytochrome c family protein